MKLHVFDLLTITRKPYIDKYLKQTGIELTTFIPNYQVSIEDPNDYKRIVHLLLVVYLKRCLSHEEAISWVCKSANRLGVVVRPSWGCRMQLVITTSYELYAISARLWRMNARCEWSSTPISIRSSSVTPMNVCPHTWYCKNNRPTFRESSAFRGYCSCSIFTASADIWLGFSDERS